jgi:hypothetical protein
MRWCVWLLIVGCAGDKSSPTDSGATTDSGSETADTADTADTAEEAPVPVQATARLLDPMSGRGVEGLSVTGWDGSSCETGADGACAVEAPGGQPFFLDVTGDSVLPHRLQGEAADAAFETISFVANATLTDQIYGLVGVERDPEKGTVVVGLDNPDLSPAYGASAAIDGSAEVTFVLGAGRPIEGNVLLDGGFSIVTFVNVEPGFAAVTTSGAGDTSCMAAPAKRSPGFDVEVVAGVISVVSFICE